MVPYYYECQRCGYKTTQKGHLLRHLNNKKECPPRLVDVSISELISKLRTTNDDSPYECQHCSKKFNNKSSMYRHASICKLKTNKLQEELESLKKEMKELKNSMHAANNTTTNNIQQNNIINVGIRDFGCENMAAIPKHLIESLFMNLRFRELLENLHCDPQYPENHNVRIKSTKRNIMEIYRNNKWDLVTFVNGLNELLLQGHTIFTEYYKKNKEKILEEDMTAEDLEDIVEQLQRIEKLSEEDVKPIRQDIQLMLEGYRNSTLNLL